MNEAQSIRYAQLMADIKASATRSRELRRLASKAVGFARHALHLVSKDPKQRARFLALGFIRGRRVDAVDPSIKPCYRHHRAVLVEACKIVAWVHGSAVNVEHVVNRWATSDIAGCFNGLLSAVKALDLERGIVVLRGRVKFLTESSDASHRHARRQMDAATEAKAMLAALEIERITMVHS